jgi:hypothetical protein
MSDYRKIPGKRATADTSPADHSVSRMTDEALDHQCRSGFHSNARIGYVFAERTSAREPKELAPVRQIAAL